MVMTTSPRAAALFAVSTLAPPAAFSFSIAAGLTSTPSTWWRALSRFCAIGSPMLPRPINPMRAMTPSQSPLSILLRMFLCRFQCEPKVKYQQAAFQNAGEPAAAEHLRKKYFHRQHGGHRGEPDHRSPGRGKPEADRGDEVDDRKEDRRSLPRDRMVLERYRLAKSDADNLPPMIEALDHRYHRHHAEKQHQPPRPQASRMISLVLAYRLERANIVGSGGPVHGNTSSDAPSGAK